MRGKQPFVQVLRFLAALAVCLYHQASSYKVAGGDPLVVEIIQTGWLGVKVFFVISGFVMVYGTNPRATPATFLFNRCLRVYPPLWIATMFYVLAFKIWDDPLTSISAGDIFRSMTLIDINPIYKTHAMYTTWTLSFEMFFYLVFALWIASSRWNPAAVAAMTVAIIEASNNIDAAFPGSAPILLKDRQMYLFLIGCMSGYAYKNVRIPSYTLFCLGSALLLSGVILTIMTNRGATSAMSHPLSSVLVFGIGTALLILGSQAFVERMKSPIWNTMGDISYAMYLTHPAIILFMMIFNISFWGPLAKMGQSGILIFYVCLVLTLSYLFWRGLEKPVAELVKGSRRAFAERRALSENAQ